jgi:ABC-2 type transport system permease protein
MLSLIFKEINTFFSSLTGYIVMVVYLLINGLFLWVFPGGYNIPESGYATLEPLFVLSPWVFLFLVPAITMRMIAEEKRMGTLELLFTRPLSDLQIILAKYIASVLLVIMSLLPTLVFFWSVYQLGNPVGSIDTGATWGSYIGLFFLAAIYAAIGIFASSVTENQIIAFILAMLLCFLIYIGFDSLGTLDAFSSITSFIINLGINEHYKSISRGVADTRDLLYFTGVVAIFTSLTRIILQSRNWK